MKSSDRRHNERGLTAENEGLRCELTRHKVRSHEISAAAATAAAASSRRGTSRSTAPQQRTTTRRITPLTSDGGGFILYNDTTKKAALRSGPGSRKGQAVKPRALMTATTEPQPALSACTPNSFASTSAGTGTGIGGGGGGGAAASGIPMSLRRISLEHPQGR